MVGKTIAQYEVLDEIGAGGMGVVYEAWDTRLERQAAIKALREELFPIGGEGAGERMPTAIQVVLNWPQAFEVKRMELQ